MTLSQQVPTTIHGTSYHITLISLQMPRGDWRSFQIPQLREPLSWVLYPKGKWSNSEIKCIFQWHVPVALTQSHMAQVGDCMDVRA